MLHLHLSDVAAQEHVALSVSVRAMSVSAMREVPAGHADADPLSAHEVAFADAVSLLHHQPLIQSFSAAGGISLQASTAHTLAPQALHFVKRSGTGCWMDRKRRLWKAPFSVAAKGLMEEGFRQVLFLPALIIASSRIFSCVSPAANLGRLLSLFHEFE